MASSSSSHQQNEGHHAFSVIETPRKRRKASESSRVFDVFINHRGPDVKETVARQLYNSLKDLEIWAFLDSEEMQAGNSFPSTIENAINSASVHIAIFSQKYAESPWCLEELVLMLQSTARIMPVFYGVKPSDLRHIGKGMYANAFTQYEKKNRYTEKLNEWKEALQSISFITGYEISNFNVGDCQMIVSAVQDEVKRRKCLYVAKHPVGLHRLVEDFERRCLDELVQDIQRHCGMDEGGKSKPQIVSIFGMGGVGKTTLAKELFNRKQSQYTRACSLFDVREAYSNNSFPSLQMKLVKDLFQRDGLKFHCTEEGTNHIGECIGRSNQLSFLIVLDDIDHVQQLDALLIMDMLKKSVDSLIIVTTRDVGVLINTGIMTGYNLKGMDIRDARELFCWHAFDQPHPPNDYQSLVEPFLKVCGGLPLSLQVIGRHVHGRDQSYWSSELSKVSKILPRDIHRSLRISFDALDYEEKQIFMDIACFFVDKLKSIAMRVWEGSGWSGQSALETLKDKCLVEEIEPVSDFEGEEWVSTPGLRMHDHLRDLGREMANELSYPRRLWRSEDLKDLESIGFQNILAQTTGRCFHSFFDKSMNSRITYFLGKSDICAETPTSLLWLALFGHELNVDFNRSQPSIPPWIPLQNLQCLIIYDLRLETLWQSHVQVPSQLKELHIFRTFLREFPDLQGISNNLEKVVLDSQHMQTEGWSLLRSLRMNLSSLDLGFSTLKGEVKLIGNSRAEETSCKSLLIRNFKSRDVVWHPGSVKDRFSSLENLRISDTQALKILISGNHCPTLQSFKLSEIKSLTEVQFTRVDTLKCLEVTDCKCFKRLFTTSDLRKLVDLKISYCRELQELSVEHFRCLERIIIKDCSRLRSVSGLSDLRKLLELKISRCPQLQEELSVVHFSCLEKIIIKNCSLLSVSGLSDLRKLVELNISVLPELQELSVVYLSYLQRIKIEDCNQLRSVRNI